LNGPLSPRAARVLYNVADALAQEGAPVRDVAPQVERAIRHRGVATARRVWLLLLCIEWQPVLTLRERRGFSWLPRERRRALLRGWEGSRLGARRRAFEELRGWIEAAAAQSSGA
jgi:hypothetical protein